MNYTPFSQRQGYINPSNIIVRESLTGSILNSVYNFMISLLNDYHFRDMISHMREEFKYKVLNLRFDNMSPNILDLIIEEGIPWHIRIDYLEWIINFLITYIHQTKNGYSISYKSECNQELDMHIAWLNSEFERHNYAYRIVNYLFIETTSSSEIATIKEAFEKADPNVITHLNECLKLLSPSNPELSTRNALKEAISAVEVKARQITNTSTLDRALKKLEKIHHMINDSMSKLYFYTNSGNTGIRHGWMEQENEPSKDEAIFVLVTSCAFINYLTKVYN